jgi:hypothetical protein
MAISDEPLQLGMRRFVRRQIIHLPTNSGLTTLVYQLITWQQYESSKKSSDKFNVIGIHTSGIYTLKFVIIIL